jgi:hypothetical protein
LKELELLKFSMEVDKLNIRSLIPKIEEYLIKHKTKFLRQNPVEILEMAYQHKSFINLWNFCLDEICEEPETLFDSNKFINLEAQLLEQFLKRDDLYLDEIDIWNSLLKWGHAHNLSISQDSTKWNKDEIAIMERTLRRFIPLVRFYHMSSEDFFDKVYPLKELLPKDLISNILDFHNMVPDRKINIDIHPPRQPKQKSVIITHEHFSILSSWIDKMENLYYNVKNTPYRFDLLYRADRDDDSAADFHAKCDNKGATIVIAKITNSEHILGGYNPLCWDSSNTYKPTNDSYIFSFTNRNDFQTAKVGYTGSNQYSICCNQFRGPSFGYGHDLSFQYDINNNSVSNNPHSYPKIDIPEGCKLNSSSSYNVFNAENYEVFQVIKK